MQPTNTITLSFTLPSDLVVTSETMRTLLLDALCEKLEKHNSGQLLMHSKRLALCQAILTESLQ
jgi:hypothetical protein